MVEQVAGSASSVLAAVDPCDVLTHLAQRLAGGGLAAALGALTESLDLRSAVLRGSSGSLLAVGGEVLHAVPVMRATLLSPLALALPGGSGTVLEVSGAHPSQLPLLRAACAVLMLGLTPAAELLDAAERDREAVADALHDGPVQSMVVARYAADAGVHGADPVLVRDAVQDGLIDVRRSLWHLRPRGADGLSEALALLVGKLAEVGSTLRVHGARSHLGGTHGALAYRFVQTLAVPEGGSVTLRREHDLLVVEVAGTDIHPEPWSLRARALGGDVTGSAGLFRLLLPVLDPSDPRTTP